MRVADEIRFDHSKAKGDYDALIMLSYAVFSITFLLLIYAASTSSGTAPGEFAAMSVFP
jgi:hypothetical protein